MRALATGAALLGATLLMAAAVEAAEPVIRVGVLKFGTVNWELDVIADRGLDRAAGIRVAPLELAGGPATQVALQAGEVDTIVSDWLWVSRQRASGADWTFVPFSTALGAVVVPAGSPIRSLADLKGRRLGVAGSPLDKSWLLLRLLALRDYGFDLDQATEKQFAAPPLLDQQLAAGRLDAVLTYWQFAARLEARGMRPILSMNEAIKGLGIDADIPMIGYVVSERWARENPELLAGFVDASRRAREILDGSDAEWERLQPLTGATDAAELKALRDAFRAGTPRHWGAAERQGAERLYELLAKIGGEALVGPSRTLAPGTFLDTVAY